MTSDNEKTWTVVTNNKGITFSNDKIPLEEVYDDGTKMDKRGMRNLTPEESEELKNIYKSLSNKVEFAPVVHAKWINKSSSSFDGIFEKVFPRYVCTNCERSVEKNFDFCPNCGAKMDKE